MSRFGLLLCALLLSGCNSISPVPSALDSSAPPVVEMAPEGVGEIVPPPLAELDCAPRAGAVTCN